MEFFVATDVNGHSDALRGFLYLALEMGDVHQVKCFAYECMQLQNDPHNDL